MTKARAASLGCWALALAGLALLALNASALGLWWSLGGFIVLWIGASVAAGMLFERFASPDERDALAARRKARDDRFARSVRRRHGETGNRPPDAPSS